MPPFHILIGARPPIDTTPPINTTRPINIISQAEFAMNVEGMLPSYATSELAAENESGPQRQPACPYCLRDPCLCDGESQSDVDETYSYYQDLLHGYEDTNTDPQQETHMDWQVTHPDHVPQTADSDADSASEAGSDPNSASESGSDSNDPPEEEFDSYTAPNATLDATGSHLASNPDTSFTCSPSYRYTPASRLWYTASDIRTPNGS